MQGHKLRLGLLYLIPFVATNLLPFLTLPIMTRYLTPQDYGLFALAQVYAGFMTGLANFCLPIGYERNSFDCKTVQEKAGLLYSVQAMVLTLLVAVALGTSIFQTTLAEWITGNSGQERLLLVSFAAAGVASLKSYYFIYLRNEERASAFVRWTLFETAVATIVTIYLVVAVGLGAMGLALGQLCAGLGTYILLFIFTLLELPLLIDSNQLRKAVIVSLPMTPTLFFKNVWTSIDKYILRLLGDATNVGLYSLGQRIGGAVFGMVTTMDGVLMPYMYKHMFAGKGLHELGKGLTPFAYLSIVPGLLASLFAEELITLILPAQYHGAIDVSIIFATSYGLYFIGKVSGTQLIFCKKTFVNVYLNAISMLTLIGMCLMFAVNNGALGVALAYFTSSTMMTFISMAVAQRYNPIPFEYGKLSAVYGSLIVASVIVLAMRMTHCAYWVTEPTKIIILCIYAVIGVRIGVISRENITAFLFAMRSLFPKKI